MLQAGIDYSPLIDFSNALDAHIISSDTFFDADLLSLFDQHLGYNYSAITMYEANTTFKDSVNYNLSHFYEKYDDAMRSTDSLAQYISSNFDELITRETKVVKSSDVVPDYLNSEYYNNLSSLVRLSYTAVIPFNGYRISVFRSQEQGDFSPQEISLLNDVGRLLQSRLILHSKIVKPPVRYTFEKLKDLYFDTIDTGVIILDDGYNVLDYNKVSMEFFSSLVPDMTMSKYFANLIPLLNITFRKGDIPPSEKFVKLDKFIIKIRLFVESSQDDTEYSVFYFVTITDMDNTSDTVDTRKNLRTPQHFAKAYKLSPRELDIVVAISNGQRYQDMADSLFISIHTVRSHIQNIYKKLDIDNQRTLLYLYNQFFNEEV